MSADNFKMSGGLAAFDSPGFDIKSLGPADMEKWIESLGQPRYRAHQIFRWLYSRGRVASFDEMTNLPLALRSNLAAVARIGTLKVDRVQTARDHVVKALLRLPSGRAIETVLIPDFDENNQAKRLTVCVSSQVGCAMGCTFCATGTMGFQENLSCGQIADQVLYMDQVACDKYDRGVTNIVFMGMGEPLLNFDQVTRSLQILTSPEGLGLSRKRITVSTVGIARRIRDLARITPQVRLAVSLHAPSDEKRSSIMPVNRAENTRLGPLMEALEFYRRETGQRLTFEYCMFEGFNDTVDDASELARLCHRVGSRVNLIMYNTVAGMPFSRTGHRQLNLFIGQLVDLGVTVTVRRSRGMDIDAACGQLATKQPALSAQ